MSVCCECLLSGRGLCVGLITRPQESCWLWCFVVCDLETSWMKRTWPTGDCCAKNSFHNLLLEDGGSRLLGKYVTCWPDCKVLHLNRHLEIPKPHFFNYTYT
jgi:hypothetical protein